MIRNDKSFLKKIFEDVILDLQEGNYINQNGDVVDFPRLGRSIIYTDVPKTNVADRFDSTKIYVENIDSFLKAIDMGPNAAVLNMASKSMPGGGVRNGSRAQEEDLCRRSNLVKSLYKFHSDLGRSYFKYIDFDKGSYPINLYGGIYSSKISIYRHPGTYEKYDTPAITNVITVPGVLNPAIDPNTGLMENRFVRIARGKIRAILRIALIHGHRKLVLGALGCGAYKNPPKHIATLFKEVLEEFEFKNAFEEICFAILEDDNSRRAHNPEGNYKPFCEVFSSN